MLTEQYWEPEVGLVSRYRILKSGTTSDGRAIEDVASLQKSIVSYIAAIAREKGMLDINKPASQYLEPGWSEASVAQEEKITVRHLMSMTSELDNSLEYASESGLRWCPSLKSHLTHNFSRLMNIIPG